MGTQKRNVEGRSQQTSFVVNSQTEHNNLEELELRLREPTRLEDTQEDSRTPSHLLNLGQTKVPTPGGV